MHSILVLSDIHGDIDTLNLILEKENYDYVFFLGDAIDYYWKEENKEVNIWKPWFSHRFCRRNWKKKQLQPKIILPLLQNFVS